MYAFMVKRTICYIVVALLCFITYTYTLGEIFNRFVDYDYEFLQWEVGIENYQEYKDDYFISKGVTVEVLDDEFKVIERKGLERKVEVDQYSLTDVLDFVRYAYSYDIVVSEVIIDNKDYVAIVWKEGAGKTNIKFVLWYTSLNVIGGILIVILLFILWMRSIYRKIKADFILIENHLIKVPYSRTPIDTDSIPIKETRQVANTYNTMLEDMDRLKSEKEKMESQSKQLISNLSHDLKSPITALSGYSAMLMEPNLTEDDRLKYANYVHSGVNDLNYMVNLLFEQVKFQHSEYSLDTKSENINRFLRDICANYYMIFTQKGYEMEADINEVPCYITMDKLQMKRVITNILDNCICHNPAGTTLYISTSIEEKDFCIYFKNNGDAIPEDVQEKIFDPFYQEDKSRSKSHGGLGLYITKQIVSKHGGSIHVYTDDEGLTVFKIMLPINE